MFPLRDSQRTSIVPSVTYILIALNIFVFYLEFTSPNTDLFIQQYALIPARVDFSNITTLIPFITSQFLHGGFFHIISNMWFLKIFGDNVEEQFGHVTYLFIYLLSGVAGGLLQYVFSPNSDIPMIGASGAVAGVLGAYLVFFPHHSIETFILSFGFLQVVDISAKFMLLFWFATQLLSGFGSISASASGGVAFWAHVGGFACGWIIAKFWGRRYVYEDPTIP